MSEAAVEAAAGQALTRLVGFGRLLRERGLPVGTGRVLTFCQAVAALGRADREGLYWAGRLTLVGRKEDLERYDEAFRAWYASLRPDPVTAFLGELAAGAEQAGTVVEYLTGEPSQDPLELSSDGDPAVGVLASQVELLRTKSFEQLTPEERAQLDALIARLAVRLASRRSRRLRPARDGRHFDLRRTVRASLRTHGEPFHRAWRARRRKPRPLVLLLDVSGSMATYSQALVRFGFAAARAGQRVEVFCFGTRLTRVTPALRRARVDDALADVGRRVRDWDGGTRIGASLKELLDRYGQHAALRGAVVVLCSDGLERGDPALLAAQAARLHRLAHRLVWVNPLKGSPRYQPLARGMAAALPHVDAFLPGHNLQSLEALCEVLAQP